MSRPILTLTTDFGLHGSYVAEMKGVVLGLASDTTLVDVCHTITPQAVAEGAFVLERLIGAFPEGTVHLAVVDPGVGTARRLIAAEAAGQFWLAPDNGLLQRVLRVARPSRLVCIGDHVARQAPVSSTFHGRDLLAPAAAHLLRGGTLEELGPGVAPEALVSLADLDPTVRPDGVDGRVQFVDSFGNLITNIPASCLDGSENWVVKAGERLIHGLVKTYGDHPPGTAIALIGSGGYLEVAVVSGSAARMLGIGVGAAVTCHREVKL
jgi:S-adenosylmethionine hydrolase